MCVIVAKEKGVKPPSLETLRKCFIKNNDGAGFMYVGDDNKVHIRKGLMTIPNFMSAWQQQEFTEDDIVVAHFRIGTSGGKGKDMTHPFPLTDNEKELKKLQWAGNVGIAHNGVISNKGSKNLSDTAEFIKEILTPVGEGIFQPELKPLLERAVDSNRLAFLNGEGSLVLLGSWDEDYICGYLFFFCKWILFFLFESRDRSSYNATLSNIHIRRFLLSP